MKKWIRLLATAFVISSSLAFAKEAKLTQTDSERQPAQANVFYEDRWRGWYSYERLPEPEEAKPEPAEAPKKSLDLTYQQMWEMPVDQFKEYIKQVIKTTIENPTLENAAKYLAVVDISRRKSAQFAGVVSMAGRMNPQYAVYDAAPTTIPGMRQVNSQRHDEIEELLQSAREEFALIVFEQQGCGFCAQQRQILDYFIAQYGWPVRFYDINEHPKAVQVFGIERTPSIILVYQKTGAHIPISWGIIGKQDLQRQIYRSVRYMRGETEPGQWAMYEFQRGSGADPLKFVNSDQEQKR